MSCGEAYFITNSIAIPTGGGITLINDGSNVTYNGAVPPTTVNFTSQTLVTVNHTLGYVPRVTVLDSQDREAQTEIKHVSTSQFLVSFTFSSSGKIIYS